jgi:hypothetical protein
MKSTGYYCQILMKIEFSRHIFEKYSIANFMKIRPAAAELFNAEGRTDVQTNITNPAFACRNFANTPMNERGPRWHSG